MAQIHFHNPKPIETRRYFVGTLLSSVVSAFTGQKKNDNSAQEAADKAKRDAEQKTLMETQEEQKTTTARKALLATPTSGFGPNTNLARSFLTTL